MNRHTVVIIDHEPELLHLLQEALEDEGYHVVAVDHPAVVAGAIMGNIPSLFLIDMMLPDSSGISVAEQLHAGEYGSVPVVGFGASDFLIRRAAGSGWFADTLEMPFDLETLLGCIAHHVNLNA